MKLIDYEAVMAALEEEYQLQDHEKVAHEMLNVVKYFPTIEQPHWIPCSERLPENTEPVNITWVNRKPALYYADIKDKPYTDTGIYCNGKWWWYSVSCKDYLDEYGKSPGDDMDEAIEVIAWMPLPEPYREGEE